MSQDETAGGVSVSGSQGAQVGSDNTQHNYFTSVGASFLSTLNPHKAAAQLRRMPHDGAVSALASAPSDDAVEVLRVLLIADEALVVALLADLNSRKAKSLIAPLVTDAPWLKSLPAAADAIARRAAELAWDRDEGAEVLRLVTRAWGSSEGFIRRYAAGQVSCNPRGAAFEVSGAIAAAYSTEDSLNLLGFPTSQAEAARRSPWGTTGIMQIFEIGNVYASAHGVYSVFVPERDTYRSLGETTSWLGFPVSHSHYGEGHYRQLFEGGAIVSSDAGTFAVRQPIFETFSPHEFPVAAEAEATSPFSTRGWTQESMYKSHEPVLTCSSKYGTYSVASARLACYRALGGTASWLGFPASKAGQARGSWVQLFEGGAIYQEHGKTVAFAAPAATVDLICGAHTGNALGCGYAVSEEQPIGTETSDRIQFFQDAVITLRDGKRELWPRPK